MTTTCNCVLPDSLPENSAKELARVFAALGDPTRLRLAHFIYRNHPAPVCACSFSEVFAISRPTMSHHLNKLVEAGIIVREKRGKWSYYTIDSTFDASILRQLDTHEHALTLEENAQETRTAGGQRTPHTTVLFVCVEQPALALLAAEIANRAKTAGVSARAADEGICDATDVKGADYVITLGEAAECPILPQTHYENWKLEQLGAGTDWSGLRSHTDKLMDRLSSHNQMPH